eukprot:425446_1
MMNRHHKHQKYPFILERTDTVPKALAKYHSIWLSLALVPSTIALLFAIQYSTSSSSSICEAEYTISPDLWLFVAGGSSLILAIVYLFVYIYQMYCSSLTMYSKILFALSSTTHQSFQCIMTLFHTIWAIVGLFIYTQQMPYECASSSIGVMILIFSILSLLNTCVAMCFRAVSNGFTTLKYIRRMSYYSKRKQPFRLSQKQIEDACPELTSAAAKGHPYIKCIPFVTPSLEFQEFDDQLHTPKIKKLNDFESGKNVAPLTSEKGFKMLRQGGALFSVALVKSPPRTKHNIIVDNIYLNNDVRFGMISHVTASVNKGIILYTHGGAYIVGSHRDAFPMLLLLSELTGCVTISVEYKLAPEFALPRCVDDVVMVYNWLCDVNKIRSDKTMDVSSNCPLFLVELEPQNAHRKIVLSGDSAGGGLCLLALQAINKDPSLNMACCAWPISPWTNVGGFDRKRNEMIDAMVDTSSSDIVPHLIIGNIEIGTGERKNNLEPSDARYSPLNGEVKGLCPMYLSVGASEMLLDDTLEFAQKLSDEGIEVEVEIEPYLCHIYPTCVSIFPEAKQAVFRASQFIKRHLESQQ